MAYKPISESNDLFARAARAIRHSQQLRAETAAQLEKAAERVRTADANLFPPQIRKAEPGSSRRSPVT
jgi:hypothetical protein